MCGSLKYRRVMNVEVFSVWLLIIGDLNTKDNIVHWKRLFFSISEVVCFTKTSSETMDQSFYSSPRPGRLWIIPFKSFFFYPMMHCRFFFGFDFKN